MFSIDDKVRLKDEPSITGIVTSIAYPGYIVKVSDNPSYNWPIYICGQDIELNIDPRLFVYGDKIYIPASMDTGFFLMCARLEGIHYAFVHLYIAAATADGCYPRVVVPLYAIEHARVVPGSKEKE